MAPASAVLLFAVTAILGAPTVTKRERVYYLDFEHINLTYYNPKYMRNVNVSTVRYSRSDPIHYMNLEAETFVAFGNNVTIDLYFYEFLSNEYRRSFVEFHFGACDMVLTDKFISPALKKYFDTDCPFKPGFYHLTNISFPNVPLLKTFPFTKGRVYERCSVRSSGERIFEGYYDTVIKQRWLNLQ